VNGDVVKPV